MILLNIHIIITIIAFILIMSQSKLKPIDPFDTMKNLNKQLEQINNEKLTNFVNNLMNASINQPFIAYPFIFTLCCIPIFNIFIIISVIQNLRKED